MILLKKAYQRLPESELDIMLALWNGTPPMTRAEIEKLVNVKKQLAPTTILSLLTRLENKNFVFVEKQGKMNLYTPLVSQEDYQANESKSVLEKLYGNSLKKFVTSLYQGKKIMPQVICKDQYLDRESVEISLKKIDDRNVLKKEWSYERAESENTVQVQWDNIKKTENSDGIYYLQIKGQDKAGNKIKDDFKVVFRVNQRGADFILSHALKKKINKYYLKEAPKIKLREQCVKQTKSRAVILKDNKERKVIGESSITSSVIADKKSERYGWYEKYYNFAKKDFEREGDYRVTFQADTKEKEIRFVVDKTPPVVHIGNLDKQIYEEKEHEFTIRVMDNYAFKELELYMETDRDILGQKETKKIIIKSEDLDENYMVRKTLTADKRYQTVRYIARDKAGNVVDSNDNGDTKVCLVTDSKTVKEYQEHKKEYMLIGIISTLGIFIVISGSGLFIFTRRKRNLK